MTHVAPNNTRGSMMAFRNVSKFYRAGEAYTYILRNANFTLPDRNIGILGLNGAGKSTLMRLMGGAELPNSGRIDRFVSVSWPLGFSGGIHAALTGKENVQFVARIYGEDPGRMLRFVADFTELGGYLDLPVNTYSSGMRAKLAFAMSISIDFECYLIDEITAVGDQTFQLKCREAFAERRKTARVIMVSHQENTIRTFCDFGVVLGNGTIRLYSDIDEAIAVYKAEMVGAT